ncbi:hypothetical protein ABPG75_010555 [Micractinium tetrahymenae]
MSAAAVRPHMRRIAVAASPRQPGCWIAAVLLLLASLALPACAQQLTPFQGRGRPPKGGVDVYLSAVVDHLVAVDDANYRFEVVLYVLLTWTDPRAAAAVERATNASTTDPAYNNGNGCAYPCTTIYAWQANPNNTNQCCDDIFLPHFEVVNVRGFSQDRVVRYSIRLGEDGSVAWWTHVQGELYTPLQFRSFPFDKQYLSVQLQLGNKYPEDPVTIIPSATGTQLYNPATGDELSGWKVQGVYIRTLNLSEQGLIRAGGSTYSAAGDPWPLNPASANQTAFSGYLWHTGAEIFLEVDRISNYYIITAILPIVINTLLALLVFSVSPRHLDTRLGIVVTLFLSLTALQFVLSSDLPSSSTVVPTQQLIIVSYCILALIGVSSIGVFWMVGLHRQQERQRRLKRAQRAFSSRWQSVTSSLGYAAAAGIVMQRSRPSGPSRDGSAKEASFAKTVSLALRNKKAQGQGGPQLGVAGPGGTAAAAAAAAVPAPLPASPFASGAGAAGAAGNGHAQQQLQKPHKQQHVQPSGSASLVAGPSSLAQLPLEAGASEVAARRQLLDLPSQEQPEGPRTGGMGVFSGSSEPSGGEGSSEGSSGGESGSGGGSGGLRARRQAVDAAALASAADAEEEGGGARSGRKLARWRRRALCCLRPAADEGKGVAAPGTGAGAKPSWLKLQWLKLKLMKDEMRDNQDYAMYVALRIDRHIFWTTLVGFLIAVVLIFSIQSTYQPAPVVP